MEYENYIWYNQRIFKFIDTEYNINDSIELSIDLSSKDLKIFSPLLMKIIIKNNDSKYFINLKYQDIVNLLNSIEELNSTLDDIYLGNGTEIKKIFNNKSLKLIFKKSQKSYKNAILFSIINSKTDYGKIVLNINIFKTIIELLKLFKNDYLNITINLTNRTISSSILTELQEIKIINEKLPTSITKLENDKTFDDNIEQEEFENYLLKNSNKISIKDNNNMTEKTNETYDNIFIDKILKNDISNLEPLIMSLTIENNPLDKLKDIISQYYNDNILPTITDDEFNISCYYSKYYFSFNLQKYTKKISKYLPNNIPIIKYKPTKYNNENILLAYELLTILIYIRLFKNKISIKESDPSMNKSILYMEMRNFTDIFIFSFIDNVNHDIIINCVKNIFLRLKNNGFFNNFDNILNNYNLTISEFEFVQLVKQIVNKIIGYDKLLYIKDLYMKEYNNGNLKLPPDNKLNITQIMNFVSAEIEMKLSINNKSEYDDEIINILYPEDKKEENWYDTILNINLE